MDKAIPTQLVNIWLNHLALLMWMDLCHIVLCFGVVCK